MKSAKFILFTALFLLTVSIGTMSALGISAPYFLLLLFVLFSASSYFLEKNIFAYDNHIFVFIWIVCILHHSAALTTGLPVGYILEFIIFGLFIPIIASIWTRARHDVFLRLFLLLFSTHLICGFLSTYFGRSHFFAALWQLQFNLKWPLMFLLGYSMVDSTRVKIILGKITFVSLIFISVVILLSLIAPDIYSVLFGNISDGTGNPILNTSTRFSGPFFHSSALALYSAFFSLVALTYYLDSKKPSWLFISLSYTIILLLSGQRQELLGYIMCVFLIIYLAYHSYRIITLFVVLTALTLVSLIFASIQWLPFEAEFADWGFLFSEKQQSARAITTIQGLKIAEMYIPLGSGLGTFAGPGAQKYDLSFYHDLGFMKYYWFRKGLFLVDTYWPNIIAETGYVGFAMLFFILMIMWLSLFSRTLKAIKTPLFYFNLLALCALTIMLSTSVTSPNMADPRYSFLLWLIIGAAFKASNAELFIISREPIRTKPCS